MNTVMNKLNETREKVVKRSSERKWTSNEYCKLVNVILGHSAATKYIKSLNTLVNVQGMRQAIKLCKSRYLYLIHLLAGDQSYSDMIKLSREARLSIDRRSLMPKGVYYMMAQTLLFSPRKRGRIISILKGYSMFNFIPEEKDYRDLIESVVKQIKPDRNYLVTLDNVIESFQSTQLCSDLKHSLNKIEMQLANGYLEVDITSISPSKSRYISGSPNKWANPIIQSLVSTVCSWGDVRSGDIKLLDKHWGNLMYSAWDWFKHRKASKAESIYNSGYGNTPFAELVVIPKPGASGRIIAKLNAWDQLCMETVHERLDIQLRRNSCFAHMDQMVGVWTVQNWISNGCDVLSVDLSNATDRIPRDLFTELLSELGLHRVEAMVNSISETKFKYKYLDAVVSYSVGQPMGMYGSFPILQVSNYMLANYACAATGLQPDGNFIIVGDDIIFKEAKAGYKYVELCSALRIECKASKMFHRFVNQFVGFDIIKDPYRPGVIQAIRPYKFKPNISVFDKRSLLSRWLMFPVERMNIPRYVKRRMAKFGSRDNYFPDGTPKSGDKPIIGKTVSYPKRAARLALQLAVSLNEISASMPKEESVTFSIEDVPDTLNSSESYVSKQDESMEDGRLGTLEEGSSLSLGDGKVKVWNGERWETRKGGTTSNESRISNLDTLYDSSLTRNDSELARLEKSTKAKESNQDDEEADTIVRGKGR